MSMHRSYQSPLFIFVFKLIWGVTYFHLHGWSRWTESANRRAWTEWAEITSQHYFNLLTAKQQQARPRGDKTGRVHSLANYSGSPYSIKIKTKYGKRREGRRKAEKLYRRRSAHLSLSPCKVKARVGETKKKNYRVLPRRSPQGRGGVRGGSLSRKKSSEERRCSDRPRLFHLVYTKTESADWRLAFQRGNGTCECKLLGVEQAGTFS